MMLKFQNCQQKTYGTFCCEALHMAERIVYSKFPPVVETGYSEKVYQITQNAPYYGAHVSLIVYLSLIV